MHGVGEVGQSGVDGTALQFVFVGKSNGVNHKVNFPPFFAEFLKTGFHTGGIGNVALDQQRLVVKLGSQRGNPFFQNFVLVGNRKLRPLGVQCLANAPGNRLVVGQPHDQAFFSAH